MTILFSGGLTAIAAEGARIGLATCRACGAAIMVDPRDDVDAMELHTRWHRETSERSPASGGDDA